MIPRTVKQGQYLRTPQCAFCQKYHHPGHCGGYQPTCPHCGGEHKRFECDKKQATPYCINCRSTHKATSNLCPTRRKLLTDDLIPDAIIDELINPFGPTQEKISFVRAPLPSINAWSVNNQEGDQRGDPINLALHASTPVKSYYDCLRMSLLFSQWYSAFIILQSIMGLTRIELPDFLKEGIGIEQNEAMERQNSASHNPGKSHSQPLLENISPQIVIIDPPEGQIFLIIWEILQPEQITILHFPEPTPSLSPRDQGRKQMEQY